MNIGDKIKEIRIILGMKQKELAKELGVRQATLSKWESNIRNPSLKMLKKLSEISGKDISFFMDSAEITYIGIEKQNGKTFLVKDIKIGGKIKRLRYEHRFTQKELAEKLEISQGTLSQWENGNLEPDENGIKKLSEIFDKPVSYFIDDESDNKEIETQSEGEGESEKQPDLSYIKYATIEDIEKLKNARFPEKVFYLRVFGSASAGKLSYLADEESEVRKVKVHDIQLDDESRYMSREQIEKVYMIFNVVGDSMSPNIMDKDKVIIRQNHPLTKGRIHLFVIDGYAILKRVKHIDENKMVLSSDNPQYNDIIITKENNIWNIGQLVSAYKDYK